MDRADEYRLRAAECLALALRMPGAFEKEQLRNMANIWESLADSVEVSCPKDEFSDETLATPVLNLGRSCNRPKSSVESV